MRAASVRDMIQPLGRKTIVGRFLVMVLLRFGVKRDAAQYSVRPVC